MEGRTSAPKDKPTVKQSKTWLTWQLYNDMYSNSIVELISTETCPKMDRWPPRYHPTHLNDQVVGDDPEAFDAQTLGLAGVPQIRDMICYLKNLENHGCILCQRIHFVLVACNDHKLIHHPRFYQLNSWWYVETSMRVFVLAVGFEPLFINTHHKPSLTTIGWPVAINQPFKVWDPPGMPLWPLPAAYCRVLQMRIGLGTSL